MVVTQLKITIKYIGVVIGLLWGGVSLAAVTQPCTLKTAEFCRNTNELVWSKGFTAAVRQFVGVHKGEFSTLERQVLASLGGPPDNPVEMLTNDSGGWLFSACQDHACMNKGALLLDHDHTIRGIAVFDFGPKGERNPRLDLILKDPGDTKAQNILTAWANWAISRDLFMYSGEYSVTHLTGVKVISAQHA